MKNMHFLLAALATTLLVLPSHAEAGWTGKGTKAPKSHTAHKSNKAASWEAHKAAKADKWRAWQESIAAHKARKAEMWNNWLQSKKAYKASKSTKTVVAKTHTGKTWDKSWKSHKKASKMK